ncbi:MAG TPA: endonuclease III [bacterium]|nr:endonuclease III [bacterium]
MIPEKKRISIILSILRKNYGGAVTALEHRDPFGLLVATVLSAQCTDERVNRVTPALFKKYKSIKAFAAAGQHDMERMIRSTGFFRNKAKNIIALSKIILEDFGGKVPDSMEKLVTLPGVARKTANIVLSGVFKKAEGIAVDTHVRRVSRRLGLTKNEVPDKIERDLMNILPRKDWIDFNYMLVNHGRKICKARHPCCPVCPVGKLCPSRELFMKAY